MAQRHARCPHCDHLSADVWRSERRTDIVVLYLICRSCCVEWLELEEAVERADATLLDPPL